MASDDKEGDFKQKYIDLRKEFERLQKELERVQREKKELERKNKNLEDQLAALDMERQLITPSPWFKPNVTNSQRKAGAPAGHKGYSRRIPTPEQITHVEEFSTDHCPHCNTLVQPSKLFDTRYIWDIPPPIPVVKELKIYRSWCPNCKKMVRPSLDNIFPHKKFGLNFIVLVLFLRMIGLTREKIVTFLKDFYGIDVTTATLKSLEEFSASKLRYKYEEIKEYIRKAKSVNLDETGWRVNGISHWLWTFCDKFKSLFVVDRSRGRSVPESVLNEDFDGVIVNDGWTAYNSLDLPKQQCLYHMNRQLQRIETIYGIEPRGFMEEKEPVFRRAGRPRAEFLEFETELRKLMRDAVKFANARPSMTARINAVRWFEDRLRRLAFREYKDEFVVKKAKFIERHLDEFFTFVRIPEVPWHNNQAERDLRPSVVIRKNTYGNRSPLGARTFETMMSLYSTFKKSGINFVDRTKMLLNLSAQGKITVGI